MIKGSFRKKEDIYKCKWTQHRSHKKYKAKAFLGQLEIVLLQIVELVLIFKVW